MQRSDWNIIGNGQPSNYDLPNCKLTIGFNKFNSLSPYDLIVCNGNKRGLSKTINVLGAVGNIAHELKPTFIRTALELEQQLGVWPSLGLVVVTAGIKDDLKINVRSMNLLPSIARTNELPPYKPVPASYHNWLAERRYALRFRKQLDWPELILSNEIKTMKKPTQSDLVSWLVSLPSTKKECAKQTINRLENIPISEWCFAFRQISALEQESCDKLFMLYRKANKTLNWWLYDHEFSIKMNKIREHIAIAQEHHLLCQASSSKQLV